MQVRDMQGTLSEVGGTLSEVGGTLSEKQGTLATVAALAAGGTLLLSRQLRARQRSVPMQAYQALQDQVRKRPGGLGTLAALAVGGYFLSQQLKKRGIEKMSSTEDTVEVDVPVGTAYNQWTQFEQFPKFMASVQEVRQTDDTHLHWCANVAGKTKEWDAEITEQVPDQRIAWRSVGGVNNAGAVTFQPISASRTRVVVRMDYTPETVGEQIGDALGAVKLTTKGNLKRFKQLIEGRGVETGAWRGTVTQH